MHSLNRMNTVVRYGNLWRASRLEGTGISACDRPYLFYICRHGSVSQEALASALFVNKSSVARRIAHLESKGYVTRTPNPDDRRVLLVSPTEKAEALLPLLEEMAREWNEIITADFSEGEIEIFSELVARAYANARKKAEELTP